MSNKRKRPPEAARATKIVETPSDPDICEVAFTVPADWPKGALLNVRNGGDAYLVTLFPEEYDYRHPERCLRFGNTAECQNFVSKWYARQHYDPRAL